MAKATSNGNCHFCNGTFSKSTITKHLSSCEKRKKAGQGSGKGISSQHVFHILVEGKYSPEYWLHLQAEAHATLEDLDQVLRDLWLECCGHCSAFTIDKERYSRVPMEDFDEQGMNLALNQVFHKTMKFEYEYDFGSTTDLALRVLGEEEVATKKKAIIVLAQNEKPDHRCEGCGKPATLVCPQCAYTGKGWVCKKCIADHECGDEYMLPAVNSPRVGVCGYGG